MTVLFRKHEIWAVLGLILLANAIFVTSVVEGVLPVELYRFGRFALLGTVLFGLIYLCRGFNGVADALRPMTRPGKSPLFYLFAIGWTLLLCLLVLTGKGLITGEFPAMTEIGAGLQKLTEPKLLLTLLVSSFIGEIVWVSYALRKLSEQFTPYVSALIVGSVWTAWWLPMALNNFGIVPDLPIFALLINQTGIALMCAFVYHHSRSGLPVLVMQLVFNATILVFPVTPAIGGVGTYWAFALTYFAAATLLFLRFGPRPLVRTGDSEEYTLQHG